MKRNPQSVVWISLTVSASVLLVPVPAIAADLPSPGSPAAADDPSTGSMPARIETFATDLAALERYYDVAISPTRMERLHRFHEDQLRRLESVNFHALDPDGQIDFLLLKNKLRFELRELEHLRKRIADVAPLMPFSRDIIELEELRRRAQPVDAELGARTLTGIASQAERIRRDLEKELKEPSLSPGEKPAATAEENEVGKTGTGALPRPSKVEANRAAGMIDELRQALKHWHDFYAGYDPVFTWWAEQPWQKADKELQESASFLRKKIVGAAEGEDEPVIGDPIGRDALLDGLQAEMIPYTPEELIEIANREFAWCETEQRRAAHDLGFGDDWHKALDHVSALHVKPGEQPRLIRDLGEEAVKFVTDRDLVTVPELCNEIWRLEMMSPERQKVTPYFTGGEVISVSYPTATMSYEDKQMSMRGNNVPFSRATVFHELIPGHHLQAFMAQRFHPYRRTFRTPFLVEGWALYWEMLMWDLGFPRNAEDRVGMLFWRSHRCARIIFSLRFHLGQMTAAEAIDFLVDRVGHERRNATAEVRRSVNGSYGPLYQAAYMLGGLQIRALHKELVDSGKMPNRLFHDAVLRENAIPIELIRARLTHQPVTPDYSPQWRFYPVP
jgi:uncharacterized protein (DUF885 family)